MTHSLSDAAKQLSSVTCTARHARMSSEILFLLGNAGPTLLSISIYLMLPTVEQSRCSNNSCECCEHKLSFLLYFYYPFDPISTYLNAYSSKVNGRNKEGRNLQKMLYRVSLTISCNLHLCASSSMKACLTSLFQIPSSRKYSSTTSIPSRNHKTTRS